MEELVMPPRAILLGESGIYVNIDHVTAFGKVVVGENEVYFVKTLDSQEAIQFENGDSTIKNLERAMNFDYHQSTNNGQLA